MTDEFYHGMENKNMVFVLRVFGGIILVVVISSLDLRTLMVIQMRKKIVFFLGIFVAGILSTIGNYFRSNYSKSESLLAPHARADVVCNQALWSDAQCISYFGGGDGGGGGVGGDGGCCADGSSG